MLRIARSRLLRRRFGVFVAAEDRAAFAALLTRAFETKAAEIGVLRLSPQDKPSIAVHLRACAAEDGRECGVALTDITELKRTELALREAEGRYHGLFEAASDAVLLVDQKTGQILEANAAALSCMAIPGKRSWR
ncbi:MAG: PAS domain-containing protein [Verrucomicrobia bacterium]|nr:PAS domain-containing protein [Verrucomicrobiota bacterium]